MVEGPGCKLKGEKLGPRVKGQVIRDVRGNAVDKLVKAKKKREKSSETPSASPSPSPYHDLIGCVCGEVLTLGKELFMFFENVSVCIRVHFLMAGGFRVNGQNLDGDGGGEAQTASLELQLSKDLIRFNKCSTEIRSADESRTRIAACKHLDICSSSFSHQRAVDNLLAQDGDRLACDLLLDQLLLPGVGNIIKNELSDLTRAHLSFLVKMTRDFSMLFYKCRKEGKPLGPYLKIYRKGKCGQCGSKTTTTRMGEDNGRLTSYCSHCQDNDIAKATKGNLPSKNSLLGWVTTALQDQSSEMWACELCTLLNKPANTNCEVCLAPRNKPGLMSVDAPASQSSNTIKQERTDSSAVVTKKKGNLLATDNNLPKKSTPVAVGAQMTNLTESATTGRTSRFGSSRNRRSVPSPAVNSTGAKRAATEEEKDEWTGPANKKRPTPRAAQPLPSGGVSTSEAPLGAAAVSAPSCSVHRQPCLMREVRKDGANKQRMFYSCPTRRCNFFLWADETFPYCEGHGRRCVLRTVLKEGPNNGRRFFACGLAKTKQCATFQWADQYNHITVR